jgi:transcriptional regulator with XRE-family HTH domain
MRSLNEARKIKNLTQINLSKLTGIDQGNLSNIEHGKYTPNIKTREKIESVLGRIDWISNSKISLSGDYPQAVKLINKLVGISIGLNSDEISEVKKLINKYFG